MLCNQTARVQVPGLPLCAGNLQANVFPSLHLSFLTYKKRGIVPTHRFVITFHERIMPNIYQNASRVSCHEELAMAINQLVMS